MAGVHRLSTASVAKVTASLSSQSVQHAQVFFADVYQTVSRQFHGLFIQHRNKLRYTAMPLNKHAAV